MKQLRLKFSNWILWENRKKYAQRNNPGIYMISITNKNLQGKKVNFKDVSYIGMTNSHGGLISRWKQFDNSIHNKSCPGHSGGRKVYKELGSYDKWTKKLHVCAMPIKCNVNKKNRTPEDLIKIGEIAYLEYKALSEFKKTQGKEPKYNTK